MGTQPKSKPTARTANDRMQLQLLAIIALALVLIITTVYNAVWKSNQRGAYKEARNQAASCVEEQMTHFVRTCNSLSTPGADVKGDLLPDLHMYYYAMQETDDYLSYTFGGAYKLVPDSLRSQIKLALSAYDQAFANGKPTDSAFSSLMNCAESLNQVLDSRFTDSGEIIRTK